MTDKKPSKKQRQNEMQLDVFEVAFEDKKAELAANLKKRLDYLDEEERAVSERGHSWQTDIEDRNDRNSARLNGEDDDDFDIRRQRYKREYEQKLKDLHREIIPEQIKKR